MQKKNEGRTKATIKHHNNNCCGQESPTDPTSGEQKLEEKRDICVIRLSSLRYFLTKKWGRGGGDLQQRNPAPRSRHQGRHRPSRCQEHTRPLWRTLAANPRGVDGQTQLGSHLRNNNSLGLPTLPRA
uniref:Uncharacterized protein n=1 Tax=Rousettus aegyptiacus TaxID=9407 RepID=A0A7J8DXR1_ROUAE|nr:hypothetical protein HJG63_008298 [Rousettus aegyptiacus]